MEAIVLTLAMVHGEMGKLRRGFQEISFVSDNDFDGTLSIQELSGIGTFHHVPSCLANRDRLP
jgi:hypothetical protein